MHIEISMYKVKISTKRWKVEKLQNKNNTVGEYSKALLNSSIEGFNSSSKLRRGQDLANRAEKSIQLEKKIKRMKKSRHLKGLMRYHEMDQYTHYRGPREKEIKKGAERFKEIMTENFGVSRVQKLKLEREESTMNRIRPQMEKAQVER